MSKKRRGVTNPRMDRPEGGIVNAIGRAKPLKKRGGRNEPVEVTSLGLLESSVVEQLRDLEVNQPISIEVPEPFKSQNVANFAENWARKRGWEIDTVVEENTVFLVRTQ